MGSQIKQEDPTTSVIGAAAGYVGGRVITNKSKDLLSEKSAELSGTTIGAVISELISDQSKKTLSNVDDK